MLQLSEGLLLVISLAAAVAASAAADEDKKIIKRHGNFPCRFFDKPGMKKTPGKAL